MNTGSYIGFVDSDDWIEKDMYEILYNNIKKYDANISMCGYSVVFDKNNSTEKKPLNPGFTKIIEGKDLLKFNLDIPDGNDAADLIYKITDAVWNKLYKRFLFHEIRFPPKKIYEDVFTTYKLLDNAKTMVFCSERKYNYLQREDGICGQPLSIKCFDYADANIMRYNYIKEAYPDMEPLCRKTMLMSILKTLYKIILYNGTVQYDEKIDELLDIIKKHDTNSCDIMEDETKLLDLLARDKKKGIMAMRLFKNKNKVADRL